MTDTMAAGGGRGGVGIRVFVQGGEVVKRTLDQIGDRGKRMWTELATGQKTANPAFRMMSGAVGELKGGLEELAANAGGAGRALASVGPAGIALAAALGAAFIAVRRLREAMGWADDMQTQADLLGITAERWQEYAYVAGQTDIPLEKLHENMLKLNESLGAYRTGVGDARVKQAFEALKIKPEDLRGIDNAADLLPLLADRLGQVGSRADQLALARRLGIRELLPLLRQGSEGIAELSEEARDLNLVVGNDTVAALEAADRQIEIAQQRIDTTMRQAVAGLADEFVALVTALADVVVWMGRVMDQMGRLTRLSASQNPDALNSPLSGLGTWVNLRLRGRSQAQIDFLSERRGASVEELRDLAYGTGVHARPDADFELDRPAPRGGGGRDTAAREAEQRRQRAQRFDDELARLEMSLFDAMTGELRSAEESLAFSLEKLEMERAQRDLAIQRQIEEYERTQGLRGISDAEAAQLRELEAQLHAARERTLIDREAVAAARRRLQLDQDAQQAAIDLLSMDAQLARTSADRHAIERRILQLTRDMERQRLAAQLGDDPNLTPEQREAALGRFDRNTAARFRVMDQQEQDRLREVFIGYGRDLAGAVRDGRLGEHIAEELQSRLLDMALSGLFDFLSGSRGGGGGGGFWGGVAGFVGGLFGGGRAGGGSLRRGYRYDVVEDGRPELAVFGRDGQMFSHTDTVNMLRELGGTAAGGRAGPSRVLVEVLPRRGTTFDAEVRAISRDEAVDVSLQAYRGAVDTSYEAAPQSLAERQAYQE